MTKSLLKMFGYWTRKKSIEILLIFIGRLTFFHKNGVDFSADVKVGFSQIILLGQKLNTLETII